MARTKVDNKLNVVIGTKAQVVDDTTIPENSIIITTDEELTPSEIGAVEEALNDGKTYARKNKSWVEVTSGGGGGYEPDGVTIILNNSNELEVSKNLEVEWTKVVNKPTIPSKTSDLTNDNGFATETYVNNKVSAVYKPQGSVPFSSLVVGLLVAANSGFVYNITDAFTTNENFVEGAGKNHSAGTNVVIIEHSGNYKFDVLGGTVDLTPYELQSNKVSSWSGTTNDTRYPSEKLVKDSLDAINVGLENIRSLSPLRFAGYFTGGTVYNDFNNLIRPFENLTNPLPDFYINNVQGAMFVCSAASDFVFNTVYYWSTEGKTTPITFNWAAPYEQGIGTTNFKVGDTISILKFAYDTVENEMFILIKVEKNSAAKITVETWNSATKTLALSDANKLFKCLHTANQTLTIPTNATVTFPIGTMITFLLSSTYKVTFSGASGVTLTSIDSLVELATQFAMASIIKTDTNTWQIVGALE